MRKLIGLAIVAIVVTACNRTESGDVEVERPVVGTVTDTLNVPTIEIGTDTVSIKVPDIEIKRD